MCDPDDLRRLAVNSIRRSIEGIGNLLAPARSTDDDCASVDRADPWPGALQKLDATGSLKHRKAVSVAQRILMAVVISRHRPGRLLQQPKKLNQQLIGDLARMMEEVAQQHGQQAIFPRVFDAPSQLAQHSLWIFI